MKTLLVILLACGFLISGGINVLNQIKNTGTLDEIMRFIVLVKTELRYKTAEYDAIYSKGKAQNYKYLSFSDGEIYAPESIGVDLNEEFKEFIKKIGTTDEAGQLTLCDEYKERFEEALENRRSREKEKIQVNAALSVFGALTVIIFFL
ncbi:MAG: hypothetical protein ACI4VW_08445 [Acutalibacteraceae bacterium]